jgi:DNA-binding response OmpR family regulator
MRLVEEAPMHIRLIGAYLPLMKALRLGLQDAGFTVDLGADPIAGIPTQKYDALIMDAGRCREDVAATIQSWRCAGVHSPVIVLTSPSQSCERSGLDLGHVLWLSKPFSLENLLGRLRLLRETSQTRCLPACYN